MNWYHASPINNLTILEPRISNHGVPLVYLSKKRENVLVYLSNAVEKYCKDTADSGYCIGIPDAGTSSIPVQICDCEYVPDAYMEILEAESKGLISLIRYENQSQKKIDWICKTVMQEYKEAENQPDYRHFLEGKFKDVFENL